MLRKQKPNQQKIAYHDIVLLIIPILLLIGPIGATTSGSNLQAGLLVSGMLSAAIMLHALFVKIPSSKPNQNQSKMNNNTTSRTQDEQPIKMRHTEPTKGDNQ